MASLSLGTLTVPDADVAKWVAVAEAYLTARGVDWSAMTDAQKVRRFLVEAGKAAYRQGRYEVEVNAAAQTSQASALAEAEAAS